MARLHDKVALITGAGGGIGRVAAELFAAEGARVMVADAVADGAMATAKAITDSGGAAAAFTADVSRSDQVAAMVAATVDAFGGLDILYNNAGVLPPDDGGTLDTPEDTWDRVMQVNLKGVWLCCKHGIPAMIDRGGGSIINVASLVALMGSTVAQIAYTASKGGVLSMTREMAVEYARHNIRINTLCPGPIQTPLMAELLSDPAKRARRLVHVPIGRFGEAEEVAKAALFLASDDSSLMTGASLVVDGGISVAYVTPRMTVLDDHVDTVLTVFPDLQGRLVGKRVTAHYFRDHVQGDALHMCNYLLAVDVDMTPVPGYEYANWDQGYGDVKAVPDMTTLRRIPWLEKTALVMCDVLDENTDEPVAVAPRNILKRQLERAAAAEFAVKIGAELEFFLFKNSYDEAASRRYRDLTPHSPWIEDYHILQTTKDEYLIRQIRNGMDGAGVPVEFSKGEAGRGQHEINLEYADALEMADRHAIYKNGTKEIAALNGRSITFMAKWSMDEVGSSCHLHSSLWSTDGQVPMADAAAPHYWLGGLLDAARELSVCFAPFVNSYKRYQPGSWAPTALAWGEDNRTCAFRMVGQGVGRRVESRIPGADCNPYLAYAATIAAGLHGIEHRIDPGPAYIGNAYVAGEEVARLPSTLVEAITEFANSDVAVEAFGADVHAHVLNTARQEWATSNQVVTDWELERGFERL